MASARPANNPANNPWDVPAPTDPARQAAGNGTYTPGRSDWQLVRELRHEATTLLADAMNAETLDEVTRQQRGRSIIAEIIKRRVSSDISSGREPWSPDQRNWLRKALDDALFGLGRFQPLVWTAGRREHHHHRPQQRVARAHRRQPRTRRAVADSDEELIEFLRWVANRSGPRQRAALQRGGSQAAPPLAWTSGTGDPAELAWPPRPG